MQSQTRDEGGREVSVPAPVSKTRIWQAGQGQFVALPAAQMRARALVVVQAPDEGIGESGRSAIES